MRPSTKCPGIVRAYKGLQGSKWTLVSPYKPLQYWGIFTDVTILLWSVGESLDGLPPLQFSMSISNSGYILPTTGFPRPVIDSTFLMEWSDKRREMTFALSAEEIAFIVKETVNVDCDCSNLL